MVTPQDKLPVDYLAEQVRDAIAHEAHELGITVIVSDSEALLAGCVESDGQRKRVEEIARRFVPELPVTNRIEIVDLKGAVKKESLT